MPEQTHAEAQVTRTTIAARSAGQVETRHRQLRELEAAVPELLGLLALRGHPQLTDVEVFHRRRFRGPRRDVVGAYPVCQFSHPRRGVPTRQQLYLLTDGRWLFGDANYPRAFGDKQLNPLLGEILAGLQALRRRHA